MLSRIEQRSKNYWELWWEVKDMKVEGLWTKVTDNPSRGEYSLVRQRYRNFSIGRGGVSQGLDKDSMIE